MTAHGAWIASRVRERWPDGTPLRGFEIGVGDARNAAHLLASLPWLELWGADPYEPYGDGKHTRQDRLAGSWDALYRNALVVASGAHTGRFGLFRMPSWDAVGLVPEGSLHFVFFDRSQGEPENTSPVTPREEIPLWVARLRPEGVLFGRDWHPSVHGDLTGAAKAVRDIYGVSVDVDPSLHTWAVDANSLKVLPS